MNTAASWFIFTDGSSRGNPGPGGWAAIIAGPVGAEGALSVQVTEIGGRENDTTNTRMEITAALRAISKLPQGAVATVFTDSTYLAKGASAWLFGWKSRGWKTATQDDVLNQDLWQDMDMALSGRTIHWKVVPGHAGHPLNERCDVIATSAADESAIELYDGPIEGYALEGSLQGILRGDAIALSPDALEKKKKKKSGSTRAAYAYVSAVEGKVVSHATWDECKKRVDGVSGARFKKVFSPEEERSLIAEWSG